MNILVTNDDEVTATGALTLAQAIIPLGNIKSWPQTIISPGTGMHIDALSNGFVSITPLQHDLPAYNVSKGIGKWQLGVNNMVTNQFQYHNQNLVGR